MIGDDDEVIPLMLRFLNFWREFLKLKWLKGKFEWKLHDQQPNLGQRPKSK